MITKIYPPKDGWHCLESIICCDLCDSVIGLSKNNIFKFFPVLAFPDGNYYLFIYSDVNNFVVVSTCKIIVSFHIVLIDDSEVNLYFSHECCGWRHLTAYYVVRMNNRKSIDTTVWSRLLNCVFLCRKELLCSVVEDFDTTDWSFENVLNWT